MAGAVAGEEGADKTAQKFGEVTDRAIKGAVDLAGAGVETLVNKFTPKQEIRNTGTPIIEEETPKLPSPDNKM